nr:MAG TPA: hypothetical protein [Caudoviricetes sp.]
MHLGQTDVIQERVSQKQIRLNYIKYIHQTLII